MRNAMVSFQRNQLVSLSGFSMQTPFLIFGRGRGQGMFLVPLQSVNSAEIKSYIAAYKHNNSSYTYRLYNKDSLATVHTASSSEKRALLNTQAVIGYFEKTVNNKDSIVIPGPLKTSVKNVAVHFRDEPSVNGIVNSASLANTCEVTSI